MIGALAAAVVLAALAAADDGFPPADPVGAFLESDDPLLRERGRRVLLARRGDAFDVFARALGDDDPRRREAAVVSLGELEDPRAGPLLRDAVEDEDPSVRVAALKALALQIDGRADERLFTAARDPWWAVRRAAARALAPVPGARAAGELGRLARDADPHVAEAAWRALLVHD
ncbi:MAG: HEAT repeat domain-containing protein, partial [Planctomycetota bacterium JB042]